MTLVPHAYPTTELNVSGANEQTVEFFRTTGCRGYAEVGVYRGFTALRIAEQLAGEGEIHLFDFEDRVVPAAALAAGGRPPQRRGALELTPAPRLLQLEPHAVLCEHEKPVFDYVFLDGAHTWALDALAFCLSIDCFAMAAMSTSTTTAGRSAARPR